MVEMIPILLLSILLHFTSANTLKCPIGLGKFSADTDKEYYQCTFNGEAKLTECPKVEVYIPMVEKCSRRIGQPDNTFVDTRSNIQYESNVPVFGRPVNLGDLYDAKEDRILNGENFWSKKTIAEQQRYSIRTGFTSNVYKARTSVERLEKIKVSKQLSISFLAGLVEVGGSSKYLLTENPLDKEQSLTYEYETTSHTNSLNNNAKIDNNQFCKNVSKATHVVSSITYGVTIRLYFKRPVVGNETEDFVNKRLYDLIKKVPSYVKKRSNDFSNEDEEFMKMLTVKLFTDFQTKTYTVSFVDVLDILRKLPGQKQSTPVKMELTPITRFCPKTLVNLVRLGPSSIQAVADTLKNIETYKSRLLSLSDNETFKKMTGKKNVLLPVLSSLNNWHTKIKKRIGQLLPEIRAGKIGESHFMRLIQKENIWPFLPSRFDRLLSDRRAEVRMVDRILKMFNKYDAPNVDIEFNRNNAENKAYTNYKRFIAFNINILPEHSAVNNFFDNKISKFNGQENWYKNHLYVYEISAKLRQFNKFTQANIYQRDADIGYVIRFNLYKPQPYNILASEGRRVRLFRLPSESPRRIVVSVNVDSVTFAIPRPFDTSYFMRSYVIRYWKTNDKGDFNKEKKTGPFEFSSSKRCVVDGLEPLTKYQFELSYWTKYGLASGFSVVDDIITKAVSPPVNVRESGKTNTEISVSWNQPEKISGDWKVSHYNIAAFKNGKWIHQISVNGLQATFAHLEGQTKYSFEIRAVVRTNGIKEYYSNPGLIDVSTCPDPPTNLLIEKVTTSTVYISWMKPTFNTAPLELDYILRYVEVNKNSTSSRSNETDYLIRIGNKTNAVITGLKAGQHYMVRAQVRLQDCQSAFSNIVYFKTRNIKSKNDVIDKRLKSFKRELNIQSLQVNSTWDKMKEVLEEVDSMVRNEIKSAEMKLREDLLKQTTNMIKKQREEVMNGIDEITQRSTGCKWQTGDGSSSTELLLYGRFKTKWDCYRSCMKRMVYVPRHKTINGATFGESNGRCYCEKRMVGIKPRSTNYISCQFGPII